MILNLLQWIFLYHTLMYLLQKLPLHYCWTWRTLVTVHIWQCILPTRTYLFQDVMISLSTPPHLETFFMFQELVLQWMLQFIVMHHTYPPSSLLWYSWHYLTTYVAGASRSQECWEWGYKYLQWLEFLPKFAGNTKLGVAILYIKKI